MTKKKVAIGIVKWFLKQIEGMTILIFDNLGYYDEGVVYLLLTKLDGVLWLLLNVLEDLQLGLQSELQDVEEI